MTESSCTTCLFPTKIYQAEVDNYDAIQLEISNIWDKLQFNYNDDWGKTHKLSNIKLDSDVIIDMQLNTLGKEIMRHLIKYSAELSFDVNSYGFAVTSWFTSFGEGDYAHIHNHGHAHISGCYYYNTSGEDGDIFFETPNQLAATSLVYKNTTERYFVKPKNGTLLLFPGWLNHGVKTNTTKTERNSLAFNIFFIKQF